MRGRGPGAAARVHACLLDRRRPAPCRAPALRRGEQLRRRVHVHRRRPRLCALRCARLLLDDVLDARRGLSTRRTRRRAVARRRTFARRMPRGRDMQDPVGWTAVVAVLLRAIMNRGRHRVATLVGSALSAWGLLAGCSSILGIESFSPATDGGTVALVDAAHDARIGDGGQQAGETGSVSPLDCLGLSNGSACASCAGSSCAGQFSSLTPGCDGYLQCICGGGTYDAGAVAQCQGDVTGPCASALDNVGDCLVTYCPECSSEDAGPEWRAFRRLALPRGDAGRRWLLRLVRPGVVE